MQRPQFGLVHFLTSHVSYEVNFAFVSKRFKLYGYFSKICILIFRIFSSSYKIDMLSIITRNISGSLGLYVDTYGTIFSSRFALTVRSTEIFIQRHSLL